MFKVYNVVGRGLGIALHPLSWPVEMWGRICSWNKQPGAVHRQRCISI